MEPETQLGMVRDATRGGASVAWVGWMFGIPALGLGLISPRHWGLVAIGGTLVVGLTVHTGWRIRERHRHRHHPPRG